MLKDMNDSLLFLMYFAKPAFKIYNLLVAAASTVAIVGGISCAPNINKRNRNNIKEEICINKCIK